VSKSSPDGNQTLGVTLRDDLIHRLLVDAGLKTLQAKQRLKLNCPFPPAERHKLSFGISVSQIVPAG
jgi:hypothetical protein